jgi:2-aminoadipate transaminase
MPSFSKRMNEVSGDAIKEILKHSANQEITSFSLGSPAKELLPISDIKNIVNRILDNYGTKVLSYGVTEGWMPLRKSYLDHIALPKGIKADVENVIMTTGATQAVELLVEVFINKGDVVLVENPTFLATLSVFDKYFANSIAIETDEYGMILDDLEKKIKKYNPKMLYTIPTFQNPTGKTLPLERRKRIAELASEYDFIVMEDDPYCDLRYRGEAIPPIKSFDTTGNVVLINSFSKILSPGLRVGTMVTTPEIIKQLIVAKQGADTHTTNLTQAICAEFLNSGLLPNHLNDMVPLYTERLDGMLEAIEKYFPEGTKYTKPEGGLFIWVDLPGNLDTNTLLEKAANEYKVAYVPGTPFFLNQNDGKNSIRLNFSSNPVAINDDGLKRLGEFFKKELL